MTRLRLREKHDPETLAALYQRPWTLEGEGGHATPDHRLRISATIAVAQWFTPCDTVADLSCGDGAITAALDVKCRILGDFAPGDANYIVGPIEQTILELQPVDLFVLSETLEHLDNPDGMLKAIRARTKHLVLSTPIGEWNPVHNPEHYWGWDMDDVGAMLDAAGFRKVVRVVVETPPPYLYDFQVWGCS